MFGFAVLKMLAMLSVGGSLFDGAKTWAQERRFKPKMKTAERDALYAGWQEALARTLSRSSLSPRPWSGRG